MGRRRALVSVLLLAFLFPGGLSAQNRKGSKRVGGSGPHGKGGHYVGGTHGAPKGTAKTPRKKKPATTPPPAPKKEE
jgi:hypothetical protein